MPVYITNYKKGEIMKTNNLEQRLAEKLIGSNLVPAMLTVTDDIKNETYVAIYADSNPVIITGPAGSEQSWKNASSLVESAEINALLKKYVPDCAGIDFGAIKGCDINWPEECRAVASKPVGEIKQGDEAGPLMAMVLGEDILPLVVGMCINKNIADIINS